MTRAVPSCSTGDCLANDVKRGVLFSCSARSILCSTDASRPSAKIVLYGPVLLPSLLDHQRFWMDIASLGKHRFSVLAALVWPLLFVLF